MPASARPAASTSAAAGSRNAVAHDAGDCDGEADERRSDTAEVERLERVDIPDHAGQ